MKTIIAATAATLFTVGVNAADFYDGLGTGNRDLAPMHYNAGSYMGAQPGIGDRFDLYHGFSAGNPDLFSPTDRAAGGAPTASGDDRTIYVGPGLSL
jgi:hypothetical protein